MLENGAFYDAYYAELTERLCELSPASGVDESFFESAVDKTVFSSDIKTFIYSCIDGENSASVRSEQRQRTADQMYEKLCEYADSEGYELTDEVDSALTHLADVCSEYYTDFTAGELTGYAVAVLGKYASKLDRLIFPAIFAAAALMLFSLAYILYLGRRDKLLMLRNISVAFIGSGFTLILLPMAVYISRLFDKIGLSSAALGGLIGDYAGGILAILLITGLVLAGGAAVLGVFCEKEKRM